MPAWMTLTSMKINSRYYPAIIITTYVVFLLLGILLGFGPERSSGGHGRGALTQFVCLALETLA
jgi:hypothetical protein